MDYGPELTAAVLDLSDFVARPRVRGSLRVGQPVSLTAFGVYNGLVVGREERSQ